MTHLDIDASELLDALRDRPDLDLVRRLVEFMLQELIEAEASEQIGAERHERTATRTTRRNGSRPRTLSTKAGDLALRIPKLRQGSFFPSILERRRRVDEALYLVVMEAYVNGVSTRKVDQLVAALGVDAGISKSEVSRICAQMDEQLAAFRTRSLVDTLYPYLFLDATYVKARVEGRVLSRAVVIATGVTIAGEREVLGVAIGDSEDGAFWAQFLRGLRERGMSGVQLAISDHHSGLKKAIAEVLIGAGWQRCRVHFARNALAKVPKGDTETIINAIRSIFAQGDAAHVVSQLHQVVSELDERFPAVAAMLVESEEELTAFRTFPRAHWRKIWSTNSHERFNLEIKRRTRVVGVFPNDASALRLITAVCLDIHDDWQSSDRRYFSEESMQSLAVAPEPQAKRRGRRS